MNNPLINAVNAILFRRHRKELRRVTESSLPISHDGNGGAVLTKASGVTFAVTRQGALNIRFKGAV